MLSLSLLPDEYLSINNGQIIVHLIRVAGGRAHLRIEADRSVPIVRGALLEREGAPRPDCLTPPPGESRPPPGSPLSLERRPGAGGAGHQAKYRPAGANGRNGGVRYFADSAESPHPICLGGRGDSPPPAGTNGGFCMTPGMRLNVVSPGRRAG